MVQLDKNAGENIELVGFHALSYQILLCAHKGKPTVEFLEEIAGELLAFVNCDAIEVWLGENKGCSRWELLKGSGRLCRLEKVSVEYLISLADMGTFWENGTLETEFELPLKTPAHYIDAIKKGGYLSHGCFPMTIREEYKGLLVLKSRSKCFFSKKKVGLYENVAKKLAIAIAFQNVSLAQRERVKELTCLYEIGKASSQPNSKLEWILQRIVDCLPPAWQYPEIVYGKIVLDDRVYESNKRDGIYHTQRANIVIDNNLRGFVEVNYAEERPDIDEGPFLNEERKLINLIAYEVAVVIEQKQAEADRNNLQEQLRHADRLATIGQLAAGVAHELNEPLGGILGFAQLSQKVPGLPYQASEDLKKIEAASLHAREVIKKLMLFARQAPSIKKPVNLNTIIEDGIFFFDARCSKMGIKQIRSLCPSLGEIVADPSQVNQVVINLVVNAIQAMPQGGTLKIETKNQNNFATLIVTDTGFGMSKEVLNRIFDPFFTTKDVGQGTGLGLPVVHGIVTTHGGHIEITSDVGVGTCCRVWFPLVEVEYE